MLKAVWLSIGIPSVTRRQTRNSLVLDPNGVVVDYLSQTIDTLARSDTHLLLVPTQLYHAPIHDPYVHLARELQSDVRRIEVRVRVKVRVREGE